MSPRRSRALDAIEAQVCREVGRSTQALIEATRGELADAARALLHATSIGFITGFFVPRDGVAAAETDGPVGTALLAASLGACGVPVRIAVDSPCADAVRAAVHETGVDVAVDEVGVEDQPGIVRVAGAWRDAGVSHAVSIERCGLSPDGRPRNMRGADVSPWTAPLDDLFTAGDWVKIGVGDGGNEIGMGKLPAGLIARTVPNGERIACITSLRSPRGGGRLELGCLRPDGGARGAARRVVADPREVPDRGTRPRDHPGDRRRRRAPSTVSRRGTSPRSTASRPTCMPA